MQKKYITALGLALIFPSAAQAGSCDIPNGFDSVYCFVKVYMDLDRQLNEQYVRLMRMISSSKKDDLRLGQREWIIWRDQQCHHTTQSGGDSLNIDCALTTTRERIQFLSNRLAECRATGCNAEKLGRVTENNDG